MPYEHPASHPIQVAPCVSFCETADPRSTEAEFESLLAASCSEGGFPQVGRVYVGSYFCENYFLSLSDDFHGTLRDLCARYGLAATLVAPIFGQAFVGRGMARLSEVCDRFGDLYDEVVANDVALFCDLSDITDARRGIGRLLFKEQRDVRYPERFGAPSRPSLGAEAGACVQASPDAPALIELDPVSEVVDVSSLAAEARALSGHAPDLAVHLPWCYATTGRTCSSASALKPDSEKFRYGRECGLECLRIVQGSRVESGTRYAKCGRTYYFPNPACRIAGAESWRIIYAAPRAAAARR